MNPPSPQEDSDAELPVSATIFKFRVGITRQTFARWERLGVIKAHKICGKKFILPHDLKEFCRKLAAGELAEIRENADVCQPEGEKKLC